MRGIRPEIVWATLGISPATGWAGVADGTIPLRKFHITKRAVAFDEDDVIRFLLNRIADRDGLTGAERERWLDQEFIRRKEGKAVTPREWLVDGVVPHRAVTLLSGDGGLGKTTSR